MSIPGVDLKAQIAWDSGFKTPAVDRTWTDVSEFVELDQGITIKYGRQDELSTADANTLDLELDNTDGRFTWGNASSPYHPNVKLGRPTRLVATIGGVDYVRYTGYADGWPNRWPGGGDTYSATRLAASSRLSRLGVNSPVVVGLEQTIATTDLMLYWPLTEAASPGKEVANRARALAGNSKTVFGSGMDDGELFDCDGRTVVKVLDGPTTDEWGGAHLGAEFTPPIAFSGNITFGIFVQNLDPTPYTSGTNNFIGFIPVDGTGALGMAYDRPEYSVHPSELPGVHFLAFSRQQTSPTTFTLTNYLDGEVIRSTSGSASPYTSLVRASITMAETGQVRQVGRFMVWDRVLTLAEIAEIADAGRGAFSGDTTDERLQRYAAWVGIPAAEVSTTPSTITVGGVPTEPTQAETLMRQVETDEAGVLYDDRDGDLVLTPRGARYNATPALTLDVATQDVGSDYEPKVDRQGLYNTGTGRNTDGTVEASYSDETSREEYGDFAYTVETNALDPDQPLQLVAAVVNANSEPRPRAPSVTINVLDWIGNPTKLAAILGLDIGSLVRVANAPEQAPETTADYFVEGYTETFGEASWEIALNLSPSWPYTSIFRLDDPVKGVLDAGNVLGL